LRTGVGEVYSAMLKIAHVFRAAQIYIEPTLRKLALEFSAASTILPNMNA